MNTNQLTIVLLWGFSALLLYFAGVYQGQQHPTRWQDFFQTLTARLSWRGLGAAIALPTLWILNWYAFVVHVRLALDRWPRFHDHLRGWFVVFHQSVTNYSFLVIAGLALIAAATGFVCIFIRRFRFLSVYALCYCVGASLAWGSMFVAPGKFLNWFWG